MVVFFRTLIVFAAGMLPQLLLASVPGQPETRLISFRVLTGEALPAVYFRPEPQALPEQLTLFSSAPSKLVQARVPTEFLLFRDAKGEVALARVLLTPQATGALLIVLRPNPERPAGDLWQAHVFSAENRPRAGEVSLLNLTGQAIRVDLGGPTVDLPDGAPGRLTASRRSLLRAAVPMAGIWRRVTQFEIETEPDSRAWIILWAPHRAGLLQPRLQLFFEPPE